MGPSAGPAGSPEGDGRPGRRSPSPEPDPQAEIARAHTEALKAGRDTYRDPATGYQVFTARYLYERGWCCSTGCRHCPW